MSTLIDEVIRLYGDKLIEIDNKDYILKPLRYTPLSIKMKDCIKILTNKADAIHYKEDEE